MFIRAGRFGSLKIVWRERYLQRIVRIVILYHIIHITVVWGAQTPF